MKNTPLLRLATNVALGVFSLASALMTMDASAQNTNTSSSDSKRKLKIYASHDFVNYFPTTLHFKSKDGNDDVAIKGYKWSTEACAQYFNPAEGYRKGNPLKFLDEPTNEYTAAWEGPKDVIFIAARHDKYRQLDQSDRIVGKLNGAHVDHVAPLYSWSNHDPDQLQIFSNENANWVEQIEIGYGRRFSLLKSKKFGDISYTPAFSAGIQMGINRSVKITDIPAAPVREYKEDPSFQGFGGTLRNKLEWRSHNGAIGLFYDNRMSVYDCKDGLVDGTQKYILAYMSNNIGVTVNPPHIGKWVRSHVHL